MKIVKHRKYGVLNKRNMICASITVLVVSPLLINQTLVAQDEISEPTISIDDTRTTLQEWVQTRKLISKEKQDWKLSQEVLNARIELVQSEISVLKDKITSAKESIAEADKKRDQLIIQNNKFKASASDLTNIVSQLEKQTITVLKNSPKAAQQRVETLSQRFINAPQDKKVSLSLRFQNVIGVLNELNKFNREISVASEVRTLEDGTSSEVTVLYVGLGYAYYVNANQTIAGYGTRSQSGWEWFPDNSAAKMISQAIAMHNNEEVAAFVNLPFKK